VLIGADEHFPVGVVNEAVVESAEEDEVVHVGGATICPLPDVVECINGCSMRNDDAIENYCCTLGFANRNLSVAHGKRNA
jgi:hypothetical protein